MAAINTSTKAVIYSTLLDEVIREGLTSSRLEAGASRVKYTGGDSCKIAKISTGGFGAYDRGTGGYPQGAVTQEWETKTITQDRGIKFSLDVMDEDETMNVLSTSNVIKEFANGNAIPELDSYRYSTIFQNIVDDATVKYGYYAPVAATLLSNIQGKLAAIRDDIGENEPLIIFMSGVTFGVLTSSTEITKYLNVREGMLGGVSTKIYSIDGVDIIPVPSARLKTEYAFSATNGFSAKAWAMDINYIIMSPNSAVAFVKHQKTRVISADQNQSADGELVLSRTVHDLWVYDNKKPSIWVSLKTAVIDDISSLLAAGSGKVTYTIGTAYTNKDTDHEYWYKNTASATAPTVPACYDELVTTGYTKIATASATDVTVTATHYLVLCHVDENGRILEFGKVAAGA